MISVIITYDSANSNKLRKLLKKYLIWEQNSVFKGKLTQSNLTKIKNIIKDNLEDNDNICIFTSKYEDINLEVIGNKKGYDDNFI